MIKRNRLEEQRAAKKSRESCPRLLLIPQKPLLADFIVKLTVVVDAVVVLIVAAHTTQSPSIRPSVRSFVCRTQSSRIMKTKTTTKE